MSMRAGRIGVGYYEVTHGQKWWTVAQLTDGGWNITNHRGQGVKADGRLGRTLIHHVRSLESVH